MLHVPQPNMTLEGEKVAIALKSGDSVTPVISWSSIFCSFAGNELASPGEYYPPTLPISDRSQAASLSFWTDDEPATIFKNAVATLKALGIQDTKLTTWIESEVWKNSPNFDGKYTQANGLEIWMRVGIGQDQKIGNFSINLSRPKPPAAEKQPGLPPPQPNPPRPPARPRAPVPQPGS